MTRRKIRHLALCFRSDTGSPRRKRQFRLPAGMNLFRHLLQVGKCVLVLLLVADKSQLKIFRILLFHLEKRATTFHFNQLSSNYTSPLNLYSPQKLYACNLRTSVQQICGNTTFLDSLASKKKNFYPFMLSI